MNDNHDENEFPEHIENWFEELKNTESTVKRTRVGSQYVFLPKDNSYDREEKENEATSKAKAIHQRGFGITKSDSPRPWIGTNQIAPCIVPIIYSPELGTGALAHFDANMNTETFALVLEPFEDAVRIDVHFVGGLNTPESAVTAKGLLSVLHDIDSSHDLFNVKTFDIMEKDHGREVVLDTETGKIYQSVYAPNYNLDSRFRTLEDSTYLLGDAVQMANRCEELNATKSVRPQFDGRNYNEWRNSVAEVIYTQAAKAVLNAAQVEQDASVIKDELRKIGSPELVELELRTYLTNANNLNSPVLEDNLVNLLATGIKARKEVQAIIEEDWHPMALERLSLKHAEEAVVQYNKEANADVDGKYVEAVKVGLLDSVKGVASLVEQIVIFSSPVVGIYETPEYDPIAPARAALGDVDFDKKTFFNNEDEEEISRDITTTVRTKTSKWLIDRYFPIQNENK